MIWEEKATAVLGYLWGREREYPEAFNLLDMFLKEHPDWTECYLRAAELAIVFSQFEIAGLYLREAVKKPIVNDVLLSLRLGGCLLRIGDAQVRLCLIPASAADDQTRSVMEGVEWKTRAELQGLSEETAPQALRSVITRLDALVLRRFHPTLGEQHFWDNWQFPWFEGSRLAASNEPKQDHLSVDPSRDS